MLAKIDRWDKETSFRWNRAMQNSPWRPYVQVFSLLLGPNIWASIMMVTGLSLAAFFSKSAGFYLVGCLLQSYLIFVPLKQLTKRHRPFAQDERIYCLDEKVDTYCFPSGHAIFFMLFWIAVGLMLNTWWVAGIGTILGILVGLSRVLLGVHFPSDVITGFLYAWATALIFEFFTEALWFKLLDFVVFFI